MLVQIKHIKVNNDNNLVGAFLVQLIQDPNSDLEVIAVPCASSLTHYVPPIVRLTSSQPINIKFSGFPFPGNPFHNTHFDGAYYTSVVFFRNIPETYHSVCLTLLGGKVDHKRILIPLKEPTALTMNVYFTRHKTFSEESLEVGMDYDAAHQLEVSTVDYDKELGYPVVTLYSDRTIIPFFKNFEMLPQAPEYFDYHDGTQYITALHFKGIPLDFKVFSLVIRRDSLIVKDYSVYLK